MPPLVEVIMGLNWTDFKPDKYLGLRLYFGFLNSFNRSIDKIPYLRPSMAKTLL